MPPKAYISAALPAPMIAPMISPSKIATTGTGRLFSTRGAAATGWLPGVSLSGSWICSWIGSATSS